MYYFASLYYTKRIVYYFWHTCTEACLSHTEQNTVCKENIAEQLQLSERGEIFNRVAHQLSIFGFLSFLMDIAFCIFIYALYTYIKYFFSYFVDF